jgi:protein-L-isoaspartate O-methyltransferase
MAEIDRTNWLAEKRDAMIERQVAARGIIDQRVLTALLQVPREHFVPEGLAEFAYDDMPLPLKAGVPPWPPTLKAHTSYLWNCSIANW